MTAGKQQKNKRRKWMERAEKLTRLDTEQFLVLGFGILILVGALILMLPLSSADGSWTSFTDALFTATTSVCVTGLVTVPTCFHWSTFGKCIILILIQLGGLGIMAMMILILLLFRRKISLRSRKLIQDVYNLPVLQGTVGIVRRLLISTFAAEGIGAIAYSFAFIPMYGPVKGICYSIFHSISAFCNAGIDLVGDSSLTPFVLNPLINLVTMALILLSGLGFPIWWEVEERVRGLWKKEIHRNYFWKGFSLQAKVVTVMTLVLCLGGAILILLFDWKNPATLGPMTVPQKVMAAFFQSITTRTAGFETIPQAAFTDASCMVSMICMFIGGSPMGTAGGIKTTTMAILLLMAYSYTQGKSDTECAGRRIPVEKIRSAVVIFLFAFTILCGGTMLLCAVTGLGLLDCMYEVISAIATVGLTRGITGMLPTAGKYLIIAIMFMGRLGPITIAVALIRRSRRDRPVITKPEENILIG